MRLLVFCGTRDAIARWDAQRKRPTGQGPIDGSPDIVVSLAILGPIDRERAVEWFHATEGATLVVDRSFLHGWKTPADTFVVFDPSWPFAPKAPETMQAVARAKRTPGFSPVFGMPYGGPKFPESKTGDSYLDAMLESYRREFPDMARQWENGQTQGPGLARMTARDLVDEEGPEFLALHDMEIRDAQRRAYLELQALVVAGDLRISPQFMAYDPGSPKPSSS